MAEKPDIVVLATGGSAFTSQVPAWGVDEGLAVSSWDVLSGKVEPGKNVLVYDGVSTHAGAGVADFMSSRGSNVEIVTPDVKVADDVGGTTFPIFYRRLYAQGVIHTPNYWLDRVYEEDGKKIAVIRNEYTEEQEERAVDQVVIENGSHAERSNCTGRCKPRVGEPRAGGRAQAVRVRAAAVAQRRTRQWPLPAVSRRRLHFDAQHSRRDLRRAAPLQGLLTMSPVSVITVLLWLSVAGLAFALARRAAYWREGRASAAGAYGWANLLTIPKRYFVDLHHVVARDPYIARTHIATAGGAILAMALVFVNYGLAIYSPWLDRLILLAALVMLAGAVFVWRRRHGAKAVPARLSRGPWDQLPLLLGSFALGLALFVALPAAAMSGALAVLVALLIGAGAFTMTFGAARGGPMKHALAGLLHLAFHPRQERFAERARERSAGTVRQRAAYRVEDAAARREGIRCGQAGRIPLEPAARFRRVRAMRQMRGGLSRVRRRPAAQSEEADPGSGDRHGRRHRRRLCGQPDARHRDRHARRRTGQAADLRA